MRKTARHFISAAMCAAGLALTSAAARADDANTRPPQIDKTAGPVQVAYPLDAQAHGEEGTIDFALYVSAGGHPTGKYKIYKSTGFTDLDNSALQSALSWHYIAGKDADGETTSAWLPLHLEFKLPPSPAASAPANPSP